MVTQPGPPLRALPGRLGEENSPPLRPRLPATQPPFAGQERCLGMGVSPACGGKHHQGSGGQGTREPRRAGSESGVGDSTAPARFWHGSGTAPARVGLAERAEGAVSPQGRVRYRAMCGCPRSLRGCPRSLAARSPRRGRGKRSKPMADGKPAALAAGGARARRGCACGPGRCRSCTHVAKAADGCAARTGLRAGTPPGHRSPRHASHPTSSLQ